MIRYYYPVLRRLASSPAPLSVNYAQLLAVVASARLYHTASVLPSLLSTASPEFQARAKAMDQVVADLDEKLAQAREGGGARAAERMRSKGKKLPRERYRFSVPAAPFADHMLFAYYLLEH
jgi:3-methylcrotonyl-CoA carboxylase beta subunit